MGANQFDDIDFGEADPRQQVRRVLNALACHVLDPIEAPTPEHVRQRHERIRMFCKRARENEGWFKGEIMVILDGLPDDKGLEAWWMEVGYGDGSGKRCDFVLKVREEKGPECNGLEVKAAFVGWQGRRCLVGEECVSEDGGQELGLLFPVNPNGPAEPQGLLGDALRLTEAITRGRLDRGFCMLFAYGDAKKLRDRAVQRLEDRLNELALGRFKASALPEQREPHDIGEGFALLVATFEITPCQ